VAITNDESCLQSYEGSASPPLTRTERKSIEAWALQDIAKRANAESAKPSSVLLFVDLELKGMLLNQYDAILEHELFKDAECVRACAPHSDDVSLLLCYAHSDFHNVFIERSFSGTVMQVLCLMLISCNPFVPH
jgi:hypothetical protein